jgi:hypothetical protein
VSDTLIGWLLLAVTTVIVGVLILLTEGRPWWLRK